MKKQKFQKNKPLIESKQEELIREYLSEEEIVTLSNEGFSTEQIAYVAKTNKEKSRLREGLDLIFEILSWIIPMK